MGCMRSTEGWYQALPKTISPLPCSSHHRVSPQQVVSQGHGWFAVASGGGSSPSDVHPCVTALHPHHSFQHSGAAPRNTPSIETDTVYALALPWGRRVLSWLLCGARPPPTALCFLRPLPKSTPCLVSKQGRRREHTSSCPAHSLWE